MNAPLQHPLAAEPGPMRFTAEDFAAMVGANLFADRVGKIELVDGVVVQMNATYNPHFFMHRQLLRTIDRLLEAQGSDLMVGPEPSIRLADRTVREPDICVFQPSGDAPHFMPREWVHLAIEVSDSSLADDLGPKARDYASAGIAEYWVVDLRAKTVHLHAEPSPDGYLARASARFGEAFASAALGTFKVEP